MLARALATPSNLLVLDEPTNDLDLETLDLLQEAIAAYPGTVHPRQPRPRFPRPDRHVGARGGGRRALDRICRRLFRHARAARRRAAWGARHGPAAAKPTRAAAASAPRPTASKRKLGFRETHLLKTLPERIDTLHAEIGVLRGKLAEADLFTRDPGGFERAAAELEA